MKEKSAFLTTTAFSLLLLGATPSLAENVRIGLVLPISPIRRSPTSTAERAIEHRARQCRDTDDGDLQRRGAGQGG